jgi:hypothetical protein
MNVGSICTRHMIAMDSSSTLSQAAGPMLAMIALTLARMPRKKRPS